MNITINGQNIGRKEMKNTRRAEKITAHLTAICALATEIEESPSIMGGDDIERLCELHEHAEAAIKLLKQEQPS